MDVFGEEKKISAKSADVNIVKYLEDFDEYLVQPFNVSANSGNETEDIEIALAQLTGDEEFIEHYNLESDQDRDVYASENSSLRGVVVDNFNAMSDYSRELLDEHFSGGEYTAPAEGEVESLIYRQSDPQDEVILEFEDKEVRV